MKRIIWSVTLIPLIATAILMQFMPESVPMHFDLSGNADRWGSKYELFIVPAIIMVVILLFSLLIIFFEKNRVICPMKNRGQARHQTQRR